MKKLFILTLALLISTWAYAAVPDLTPQIVTLQNPDFKETNLIGWNWKTNDGTTWSYTSNGAIDGQYIRMTNINLNGPSILSQNVKGVGPGTYVVTAVGAIGRYGSSNNYAGSLLSNGYGCLYVTTNLKANEEGVITDPGFTKINSTGDNWTNFTAMFSTSEIDPELQVGFGMPKDSPGSSKAGIRVDKFVLTYYPTMDQDAVKAYLDGTDYTMVNSVSLDETSKTVEDKIPFTLNASITPADYSSAEKGVIWSSSNEDVATVDENGNVTPAGAGTCDIIAASKADPMISAKCELTVEIPEVQVTKVSVSIEGENPEQKLEETKTLQLLATVEPQDASNKKIIWSSSDESIATVDVNGVITGIKAGKVTITATSEMVNTVKGSIELTVYKNAVTGITLSQETAEIEMKKTLQLSATVEPDNATYPEIKWSSSDESIASVDEATGLVTGISAGTVDIIATADGVSSTCIVTVKRIEVEDITLNASAHKMVVGATVNLTATVSPSNATDPSVKWTSSNESVATVSESGVVTGTGIGTAIITATAGSKSSTCSFEVLAAVELQSETLSTITNPRFDNSPWNNGWSTGSATWSQKSESNAQVWGGKTYARLYSGTLSPGEEGDFITQTITLEKAGVYTLSAYTRASRNHSGGLTEDQFGLLFINEGENIPTEYEGLNCAKTRTSGWEWVYKSVVIATNEPNTKVTFGYGLPKECSSISQGNLECSDFVLNYYPTTLDVNAVNACVNKLIYTPVKSIELPETLALIAGMSETLTAKVSPEDANNTEVVWTSSDETIATVDQTGKVTATNKGGTAIITVTSVADAMIKAECTVTVTVPVNGITIYNKENEKLGEDSVIEFQLSEENKEYQLSATISPANATNSKVAWSSSETKVATVDETGKVTVLNGGETIITATSVADDKISASCKFKVTVPAIGLEIQDADMQKLEDDAVIELHTGDEYTLTAVVKPSNTTDKVIWSSSNTDVAEINTNGVITAKKAGETTITAELGDFSFKAKVVITDPVVTITGVSLNATTADMKTGETLTLTATITPANATSKNVSWSSSDPEIASVDQKGLVTALKSGSVTISATAGGKSASCVITITDIKVTGITLDQNEIKNLVKGETVKLIATVDPENATDKTVAWSTNDETIATVDLEGNVTGVNPGTAIITAKAGDESASCVITVIIPSESITLSKSEITLEEGDEFELTYTIDPEDATDAVTWSSSDETIVTVDQNGKVKAIAVGEATITAQAGENTAVCLIKVEKLQTNGISNVPVKMTCVDYSNPDKSFNEETARSGYNKISGGSVGFGNTGWGVNYITYMQVDVSKIKRNIISATLSFEASGSTDSKRATKWGVGYNNSAWSADMTYNSADKSINLVGAISSTSTSSASSFETLSFDITKAVKNADENGLITLIVYETEAAGGYLKNPVVTVDWTTSNVYEVSFTESNGVAATVTMDNATITEEIFKTDGTYNFKATAVGYQDYNGEFTVDGADINVEFTMTPKATLNYTVKNNVNTDVVATGSVLEGEDATVAYNRYILAADGTVWMKDASNKEYNYTFTPDYDNYVVTLDYTATDMTNGIFFAEAEDLKDLFTATSGNNANIRCSNAAGGYASEAVEVIKLKPGTYKVAIGVWGGTNKADEDATKNVDFVVKAGEQKTVLTRRTNGSWGEAVSEEFTLEEETSLTFEGADASHPLDYILITGSQVGDADGDGKITINDAIDIANYVLENKKVPEDWEGTEDEWNKFYLKVADINGDKKVTISDASAAVSLTLEPKNEVANPLQARVAANYVYADNLVIGGMTTANGKTSVAVTLDNSTDFVAVQADIFMPEGVYFDVKPGSRIANSHSFQTKRFDDNHVRVVIYTFSGNAFADNNEALFEIVADSYISDPTDIALAYMLASDAAANAYTLGARYDGTTGVAALGFDSNAPVKVYDLNGRYISDKVEGLEQGFYIIRQGDNAKKVRIR